MTHSAYKLLSKDTITSLNLTLETYEHIKTGAQHYHLNTDHDENVFMVAFRTLPSDSTGVAHVLEHTALCGSKNFPVRDPFFMMIKRSMNTFMNAFTSSDWTAYPFATQNTKDFDNLLQVYLDAAFFSRLDPQDFSQEGHRIEVEDNTPGNKLVYKGVVYNEMKGAMSSTNSTLWQSISSNLFKGTTYQFNSGGDPLEITQLKYDDLIAFYKTHYHPSNAIFMTSGNIPVCEHHARIDELALTHFEKKPDTIRAGKEQQLSQMLFITDDYHYTPQENNDINKKNFIHISWILGESCVYQDVLEAELISGLLLDNSASPLQLFLETNTMGSSPSSLCGMDNSGREITFTCGIEGAQSKDHIQFKNEVFKVLEAFKHSNIDPDDINSILHQMELSQREITGNSYPYGLSLMLNALPAALHDGNPLESLDIDASLASLRQKVSDPNYIPGLIDKLLLNNGRSICIMNSPNLELQARNEDIEQQALSKLQKTMTTEQIQRLIEDSKKLEARQLQEDPQNSLPQLEISDIPKHLNFPKVHTSKDYPSLSFYQRVTNGVAYQDIRYPLPQLSDSELNLLPVLTQCLTELGSGEHDYLTMQRRQSSCTGGIHAFQQTRLAHHTGELHGYWGVSGKALIRNHDALNTLLSETIEQPRFDELTRIRELIQQTRAAQEKTITSSGHVLAMQAASSSLNPLASMLFETQGLQGIKKFKALDDSLNDENKRKELSEQFTSLHKKIIAHSPKTLIISDQDIYTEHSSCISHLKNHESSQSQPITLNMTSKNNQIWLAHTQVNFCAKAYQTVGYTHQDAPYLTVLGSFLRNGYLHRTIREQGGAYGGGASQDSRLGLFKFYSYRDPRLQGTLDDFNSSIQWLLDSPHKRQHLNEAIMTVVASIDKPLSPSGEAKHHYSQNLLGLTDIDHVQFRDAVLSTSIEDIKRVAERYLLTTTQCSTAIITNSKMLDQTQFNSGLFSIHEI
jgi:presequence protease